jgi:hypothetical protein
LALAITMTRKDSIPNGSLQDFRISQPQARSTYLLERYSMHIAS